MTTPLNSQTRNAAAAVAPTSGVNALQDVLGRMAGGGAGSGTEPDFSRMVAQYRQAEAPADKPATPPAPMRSTARAAGADPAARALTQRLTEQTLQRARLSAQMQSPARPAEATPAAPGVDAQRMAAKPAERSARASAAEGSGKTTQAKRPEGSAGQEDASEDDANAARTPFTTAQGEGVAWVREIAPPAGVDPNDAAGMMNWLAALTEGDAGGAALTPEAALAGPSADALPSDLSMQGLLLGAVGGATADGAWALARLDRAATDEGGLSLEGMTAVDAPVVDLGEVLGGASTPRSSFPGLMAGLSEPGAARHASSTLAPSPGTPQFAQALSDQVAVWVSSARAEGPMTAELKLNPAEMGPINIKIAVDGQAARIDFAATALETRQAIEASLGNLSKALEEVGLNLTGGDVSSQFRDARGQGQDPGARGMGNAQGRSESVADGLLDGEPLDLSAAAARVSRSGLGGLDLYA
ncbi:MAG: flagellar hook-length control protein FliK [Aquabacterium sp.]